MANLDTSFYEKKKSTPFYTGLIFLVLSLAVTGALYGYNYTLEQNIAELESQTNNLENSIAERKTDSQIQVYQLYQSNASLLNELDRRSQIPQFVSHLKKQMTKYGISAQGFTYQQGVVQTNISAPTIGGQRGVDKIVNLFSTYPNDEKALFDIGGVTRFSGYENITFSSEFILK